MQQVADFGISAVARLAGCAECTVRRYDSKLGPRRDSAGRRVYTPEQVELLRHLLARKRVA